MSERKPFLVLGAGLMGRALAFDLVHSSPEWSVTLADIDLTRATNIANTVAPKRIRARQLDVQNYGEVVKLMAEHRVVISAVTFHHNHLLTKAAIEAGCHFCDLGHDDDIVARQLSEGKNAEKAGVTIIANCGLAPGLADILAMHAYTQLDSVDSIQMRVGGLPQHPHPPFNYQLVFSAEGLIEEYTLEATILRDGELRHVESLTEIEHLTFPPPFGELEAFHTGGGASRLPQLLKGKVRSLEYKTIRYKGHCEKMKTLLDLGFAGNEPISAGSSVITAREMFLELLKKRLTFNEPDAVLLLVTAIGKKKGAEARLSYRLVDLSDGSNSMTAMMRTTSFPTSIIAQLMQDGTISRRGAFTAEEVVPADQLITELKKRNVRIETSH